MARGKSTFWRMEDLVVWMEGFRECSDWIGVWISTWMWTWTWTWMDGFRRRRRRRLRPTRVLRSGEECRHRHHLQTGHMAPSHRSSPPSRRPKSSTSRRHSLRRAWARRGRPGRCRVAGLPPSRGAPSLGGRGDHLGSPRGRVGRPIRLLAGGRRRLRDFGRPRRLQPSRAAPAGSWGRRAVGPTPEASRGRLARGCRSREARISHACGRSAAVCCWPGHSGNLFCVLS